MDSLLAQVRLGQRRAIARLMTRVERSGADARVAVMGLYGDTGRGHIIGVTGAPGTGKSTFVNELAKAFRKRGCLVGVVAVDPSSPFTGGAILGDRIRLRDLSGDKGVFIRSMASRGRLGGLARATSAVVKVLDAAGFDVILLETVGAGQAEVDIARTAHTTVVIEAPGLGDDIQSIKAGILEIADVLVVNKADRPGAANTVKSLRAMLHLGQERSLRHHGRAMGAVEPEVAGKPWRIEVFETIAVEGGGVERVVEQIVAHKAYLKESGEWLERERERSEQEIQQLLQAQFMKRLQEAIPLNEQTKLIGAVARREIDPYSAVERLFEKLEGVG